MAGPSSQTRPITAQETLRRHWGYDSFRPLQEDIVNSVLAGRDTLGLMPTGGGKSITFQVPGMMLPGVTLVVTPLISLMKDQVDNLKKRRIKAVFLHSGMTRPEKEAAREKVINGGAKFLYISPERLANKSFMADLKRMNVGLMVVDEAHCISQWGYDFRPSYLNIKVLRKAVPGIPILALTATATPEVARDICTQLEMSEPNVFRMSFTRENINYIVRPTETKIHEVFHILSRTSGSAIVYVRSRRRTGEIAEYLTAAGIPSGAYHAGLSYELKEERQNAWKQGTLRVMVATNAFGMGIDKPDVRVVIHHDLPPSLEEYYQEAGRAGRDGLKSYAVLLTSRSDKAVLRRRVSETFPDRDVIRKVYERVCNFLHISVGEGYDSISDFDIEKFCRTFSYQERQCRAALHLLGQAGYLEYIEEAEHRARVQIIAHREELYHIRDLSDSAEQTLTFLLRGYTGLFSEYVCINEASIAASRKCPEKEIYENLLELRRAKVLNYIPRSRTPLIYLPTSREEPRYVVIGRNIYEDRKEILSNRLEAMIDYAFNSSVCRENRMLEYFGEKREARCGRCDTCRAARANPVRDRSDIIRRVMDYVKGRPDGADFRWIEKEIPSNPRDLASALSFLVNEGFLLLHEGIYRIRN